MAGNAGITDKRARDVLVPPLMAPTSPSVWPGDSGSHRQVTLGEGGEGEERRNTQLTFK